MTSLNILKILDKLQALKILVLCTSFVYIMSTLLVDISAADVSENKSVSVDKIVDKNNSLKIVVLDTEKVIQNSVAFKDIKRQIDTKQNEFKESIQKEEPKLKKRYQDLESKKKRLSEEEMNKLSEELQKDATSLERKIYFERGVLEKAWNEAIKKLSDKIVDITKNESDINKYDIVLERNSTIYVNSSIEITSNILNLLNKELPNLKVNFEKINENQLQISNADEAKIEIKTDAKTEAKNEAKVDAGKSMKNDTKKDIDKDK